MLANHLKIALRSLGKHKGYSFINIAGLGIGLACCFLIVLYVQHELSYDRFHENADRTYRLILASRQDPANRQAVTASAFAPHLKQEFPDIEQTVRFFTNSSRATLRHGAETRTVNGVAYADPSVFEVFDFPLLRGNPATALETANTVVITPDAATAWFGNADPVGKVFTFINGETRLDLEITGVLEDIPSNSHLQFDYLVSFSTLRAWMGQNALEEYINYNYYTYLLLREGFSPLQLTSKFSDFLRSYRGEEEAKSRLMILQPLTDIHFTTGIRFDVSTNSDRRYLYIFSAVALFVLLIAAINFMNLSTARAAQRGKEVGVRKVAGASRIQLIRQFISESILASLFAIILALILLVLARPLLNVLIGREITFRPAEDAWILALLVGIGLLAGLIAGSYPAFILSAFKPVLVLKGLTAHGQRSVLLRKGLIIVQFSISVFLIVAVVVVYSQLDFMKSRDLGFNKEQVVVLGLSAPVKERFDTFRQSLLRTAAIQEVALTGGPPGRVNTSRGYQWPGKEDEEQEGRSFYTMFVDSYALEALGMDLVAGRNFSEAIETDVSRAYLLNEAAVRELGWDDPVGRPFKVWDEEMGQVIGVVRDFHFKSLHQEVEPLVLDIKPDWSWNAAIRIAPGHTTDALDTITRLWKEMDPELPMTFRFLDEDFDRLYRAEEQLGTLFGYFTTLAILIACLGLFGLAAFTAEQRTKEIGVRKVLGASVAGVVALLSKDFVKLVVLAFIVAAPLAFLVMRRWLEDFAYRIEISWWVFLLAGLTALGIALLTVSYQAVRAARADPVKALRYE